MKPLALATLMALTLPLCMLSTKAAASEIPLPEQGATLSVSTTHAQGLASRGNDTYRGWLGLRLGHQAATLALPVGYARPLVTWSRYQLVPRLEVAPMIAWGDAFAVAGQARLGLDSRWIGDTLGALLGGEVDGALQFGPPFDRRTKVLGVIGVGHQFDWLDAWLTGRGGYTFGGQGGGALTYEVGLSIALTL